MPVFHELQYAVRTLRKNPGFTAVAAGVLALGIGANTAIFSVVNAVLLRPLPFQDPDRLVMVWEHHVDGSSTNVANPVNFLGWQKRNHVFGRMATFVEVPVHLAGEGEPEEVPGMAASADFFSILGVQPLLGRTFAAGEDRTGHNRVAILSYELWKRRFGGDPKIIGKPLALAGVSPTIIGVMPPGFRFPDTRVELWQPFVLDNPSVQHTGRFLTSFARLKPGVTLKEAQSDMDVVASQLRRERPDFDAKWGVNLVSMREQAQGETRAPLLILFAAVGLLLLIACANVANLMLMRASGREKEFAIRASLGAGRLRLIRQLLIESLTLSVLAGALGVIIAVWVTGALVALLPKAISIHNVTAVSIDHTVLAFAVAISLLTGLLFGLAPAFRTGRADLHTTLKEGGRGGTNSLPRQRLRSALVIAEVALSMVLLIGAGLMIRSFVHLLSVSPGFEPDKILTAHLTAGFGKYRSDERRAAFLAEVLERIRLLPGVRAAGSIHYLPLSGSLSATSFYVVGRPVPRPGDQPDADTFVISPGYFSAMRIPLLHGRTFSNRDRAGTALVAVINRSLARHFFPDQNPIGQRLVVSWGQDDVCEIVGVVGDVRHRGLEVEPRQAIFLANAQQPNARANLVIRTDGEPLALASAVKAEVHAVDKDMPVADIQTMEDYLSDSVAKPRFESFLLGGFAALALALAAIGLFGVISYSVAQRAHEIGIRMALGAEQRDVLGLVLRQGLMLTAAGIIIGLAASFALTRFLTGVLYGVAPTDPLTFAAISALLAAVALAASYLPARRAARVDPMIALRYE